MKTNTNSESTQVESEVDDAGNPPHEYQKERIAFGIGLQKELDTIGYPPAPIRAKKLAKDLGITRSQVFKIFRGASFAGEGPLYKLAELGISLNRALKSTPPDFMHIRINGKVSAVLIERTPPDSPAQLIAVEGDDGVFELQFAGPGKEIPESAIRIQSMSVPDRFSLAIVDDDEDTLEALTASMSESFYVTPYARKSDFLPALEQEAAFNAYLVDWRLPDVVGDELIKAIRKKTGAPIFILTGASDADEHIANALDYPNVHHATKPASTLILSKRITSALNH